MLICERVLDSHLLANGHTYRSLGHRPRCGFGDPDIWPMAKFSRTRSVNMAFGQSKTTLWYLGRCPRLRWRKGLRPCWMLTRQARTHLSFIVLRLFDRLALPVDEPVSTAGPANCPSCKKSRTPKAVLASTKHGERRREFPVKRENRWIFRAAVIGLADYSKRRGSH